MASKDRAPKKSKFSKKSKKTWRVTDIKDVEDFYENKLLEERLGGPFSEKPDKELFFVEKVPVEKKPVVRLTKEERKRKARETPPTCFKALENSSKVPDPIIKRNTVRSKEERKSKIQKDIEEKLRQRGIVKHKEQVAAKNRLLNKKTAKLKKPDPFNEDLWTGKNKDEYDVHWLEEDTLREFETKTGNLKVKVPNSTRKKPSVLPSIEMPHPGISYNPSETEHLELLHKVAEVELKMIKAEEHLKRVTTGKFSKITRELAEENQKAEMSQGLFDKDDSEEEDDTEDYKPVNPPALLKRKPLKKKKKARLLKAQAGERKKQRIEKKKLADVYRLKTFQREILEKEALYSRRQERRKLKKIENLGKTKLLGRYRYLEPLQDFQRPHEIRRNLRSVNPCGSILIDRFYSLQKRNVIEPTGKKVIAKKPKMKKYFKKGYKVEDIPEDIPE